MKKKILLFLTILLLPVMAQAAPEIFYVSQSGGSVACGAWGTQSTQAASWHNTSTNWSTSDTAGKINFDDTVRYCGTITTDLYIQQSGKSGQNIVLDAAGATINARYNGDSKQYLTIQNITFQSGRSVSAGCLHLDGASYITVTNMTAQNIPYAGDHPVWLQNAAYVTIDGLNLDGLDTWGITVRFGDHVTLSRVHAITDNTVSADQKDFLTSYGGRYITLEKSFVHQRLVGTYGSPAKNDIWETGCSDGRWYIDPCPGTLSGFNTIRYNMLIMDKSGERNSNYYLTGTSLGGDKIYGNVFINKGTNELGQMIIYTYEGKPPYTTNQIYNNTFVATEVKVTTFMIANGVYGTLPITLKNNIIDAAYSGSAVTSTGNASITYDHNIWRGFNQDGTRWLGQSCAQWASGHTGEVCEVDPKFINPTDNDFRIGTNSPGYNAGTSLPAPFDIGLASSSVTFPDPPLTTISVPFEIGAYQLDPDDTTPPVRYNSTPGYLPSGTTQTNITLDTTDDSGGANCKWDGTPGVTYASQANTFDTTGGSSHSDLVTGLSDGNCYTYYVKCQDISVNLNTNPDDYPISFCVQEASPDRETGQFNTTGSFR